MSGKIDTLPTARLGVLPISLAEGLIRGYCALVQGERELWVGKRKDLPAAIKKFANATAVLCHTEPGELRPLIESGVE